MIESTTNISWTDHTFNPWWGCTKIAPGCDNCYAAALDKRTGGDHWNVKTDPRISRKTNWSKIIKIHKEAEVSKKRVRVFCGSMMDWCDNSIPVDSTVRTELWDLIRNTPWIDWQLLTKRAGNIKKFLPGDWGGGYDNVWLGVTVEDNKYGLDRLHKLLEIPAKVRFLSCEPLLESLTVTYPLSLGGIHWVIIGGESGSGCRKMNKEWVYRLINQCNYAKVPVWFKQWGGNTKDKGGNLVRGRVLQSLPERYENV